MPRHHIWKRVLFAPDDVFALASDVTDYPNFINFITAVRIKNSERDGETQTLLAEVRVHYKYVRERFSTHVTLDRARRTVDVRLARGPFRKLRNAWRIHALDDGSSLVEFRIDYELAVPFLGQLLRAREDRAAAAIMTAFERRAAERFAPAGGAEDAVAAQIASIKGGG